MPLRATLSAPAAIRWAVASSNCTPTRRRQQQPQQRHHPSNEALLPWPRPREHPPAQQQQQQQQQQHRQHPRHHPADGALPRAGRPRAARRSARDEPVCETGAARVRAGRPRRVRAAGAERLPRARVRRGVLGETAHARPSGRRERR
jgi:hypothetical protein